MITNKVKGFSDFSGHEAIKRREIMKILEEQFILYGFVPAETPLIEHELFVVGENASDEAVRDVYRLKDRKGRELALRYEFTFQLKRLSKNQKLPYKRYQIGHLFRDEPIRKGRSRQFIQADIDTVGSGTGDEAEILAVTKKVFDKLAIPIEIRINNRKLINEILVSENIEERNREQVIRELDKLDKLTKKEVADNLKKLGAEHILKLFTGKAQAFEKYSQYKEIKDLVDACETYNIPVIFSPTLARGLSYYNGSLFEVWSKKLGVSLAGGGSYEVEGTQATGISFGVEPLFLLATVTEDAPHVQIISIDQDANAVRLAENLRENKIPVTLLLNKTTKKALEYANTQDINTVVFVGKSEVKEKKYKVKDMKTGKEQALNETDLIKTLL